MEMKRKLTRVREGVTLDPGETLKYTKEDGYFASKPASTRVGTEKGRRDYRKEAAMISEPLNKAQEERGDNSREAKALAQKRYDLYSAKHEEDKSRAAMTKGYAKGGKIRGCGAAVKGLTKGKMR